MSSSASTYGTHDNMFRKINENELSQVSRFLSFLSRRIFQKIVLDMQLDGERRLRRSKSDINETIQSVVPAVRQPEISWTGKEAE